MSNLCPHAMGVSNISLSCNELFAHDDEFCAAVLSAAFCCSIAGKRPALAIATVAYPCRANPFAYKVIAHNPGSIVRQNVVCLTISNVIGMAMQFYAYFIILLSLTPDRLSASPIPLIARFYV